MKKSSLSSQKQKKSKEMKIQRKQSEQTLDFLEDNQEGNSRSIQKNNN